MLGWVIIDSKLAVTIERVLIIVLAGLAAFWTKAAYVWLISLLGVLLIARFFLAAPSSVEDDERRKIQVREHGLHLGMAGIVAAVWTTPAIHPDLAGLAKMVLVMLAIRTILMIVSADKLALRSHARDENNGDEIPSEEPDSTARIMRALDQFYSGMLLAQTPVIVAVFGLMSYGTIVLFGAAILAVIGTLLMGASIAIAHSASHQETEVTRTPLISGNFAVAVLNLWIALSVPVLVLLGVLSGVQGVLLVVGGILAMSILRVLFYASILKKPSAA